MMRNLLQVKNLLFFCLFLTLLGLSNSGLGQTTIISEGFNNSSSLFTLNGGTYYTGNSATNDTPANSPFAIEGTHSRGLSNGTATLASSNINTTGYSNITLSLRAASFAINDNSGMENNDYVGIEISTNGGANYTTYLTVTGNNSSNWAYSATGIASTSYGTAATFSPSGGGTRATDGYSTLIITNLPAISNLRVIITMDNSTISERWVIDDFKITGTAFVPTSPYKITTPGTSTFTVPPGVTQLTVECWGGGGGGHNTKNRGGGGGAYAGNFNLAVTPGTTYSVTVGTSSAVGVGEDGGTSSFGSDVVAVGGKGGGDGGQASLCTGTIKYSGGNGGYSTGNGGAGGGGSAGSGGNGGNGGNTANNNGGAGGIAGSAGVGSAGVVGGDGGSRYNDGVAGSFPGGGGGERGDDSNGAGSGGGGNGQVIISWSSCPTYSITSTTATPVICAGSSSLVSLSNTTASNLPVGNYTVTYDLSSPNGATGLTANMTVTTAGDGSFTTSSLANIGNTTVTITNLTLGSCSNSVSSNNTASTLVAETGTWLGTTSTDWNTASNWCGGIPMATTDVTIPSLAVYQPIIGAAGGLCRDINIGSGASLTISGSNVLTISGNWTNNGSFTPNTSTVVYNGSSQIIGSVDYFNLTLSGGGTKTLQTGTKNIGGNFTMTSNSTTTSAVVGLTIGGNVYLETSTFFTSGPFTHNVGGNWTNNGWGATFTPGTGTINFTGNDAIINGTNATQNFNNIIISKTTGQTLSVGGSTTTLTVGGTFTETSGNFAAPATMSVGGDLTLTSGTFSVGSNVIVSGNWVNNGGAISPGAGTVTMNGVTKIIGGTASTAFSNLTIGNAARIALANNQAVTGVLTLANGVLSLGAYNLTLGASSSVSASSYYTTNMIVADGTGELRKIFTGAGSFMFPIGDNSDGTANYSPMTISFASGTFAGGAYAGVSVTDAKHPNNTSTTNYLSRYWTVSQSGITSFSSTVTGNYEYGADISGQEYLQNAAEYTGSFPWNTYSALASSTLTATGVTAFGDFTGMEVPPISVSPGSLSGFTYILGSGPSAQQQFNVSGANLTANLVITPPADFEISLGSGFQSTPITLTQSGGVVSNTVIYARLKSGLSVGNYNSENVVVSSSGKTSQNVTLSGSVTSLSAETSFWYKADVGVNGNVTSWNDQTSNGNNAINSAGNVSLLANNINFNPSLQFTNLNRQFLTQNNATVRTFILVVLPTSTTDLAGLIGAGTDKGIRLSNDVSDGIEDASWRGDNNADDWYSGGSSRINGVASYLHNFKWHIVNQTRTSTLTSQYYLGGYFSGRSFSGNIAEVIAYNNDPTDGAVESYLALKYGITLGSTSNAIDYVNPSGSVIWAGSNTYQNDVAGLGYDGAYGLNQKVSSSINVASGSSRVVMATTNDFSTSNISGSRTALSNGQYLIWGHNNLAVGALITDGGFDRVSRIWKTQNTGVSSNINLQIDLTGFPAPLSGLNLILDNDGNFDNGGTTVVPLTNSSGNLYTASVNFSTGTSYFTIGKCKPVSVTVNSPVICAGSGGATITASPTPAGTYNYSWTVPGGATNPGNVNSFNATISGAYSVVVINIGGCTANASGTLTVNPLPIATIVYSGSPYCASGTANVTQTGQAGGTYSSTSGLSINSSSGAINLNTSTVSTYTVTYSFTNGTCLNTTTTNVTINAIPADVTVSGGGTFCGNATITASGGTGGTIYYQGTTSGGTSTAILSSSQNITSTGTYYFRARSAAGCWGNEGSVTVTINTLPATVTVSGGGTSCGNATISASNGSDGIIYFQGIISGGTSIATPSISQNVTTSGTYYFRARSAAGCWGTEGSATVTIDPTPAVPSINAGSNTYTYDGGSKTATVNVGANETVDWYAAPAGGSIVSAPAGTNAGTYSAYAEARNTTTGCVSLSRILVTLTIDPLPLSITANNQSKCIGSTFTFTGSEFVSVGLINGDGVSSVTLSSLGSASSASVGNYPIVASSAVGTGIGNYTINYYDGTLVVNPIAAGPGTTGALICVGSGATLTASGASTGEFYRWYDVASGGIPLKTSTNNTDNTYATATLGATTNFWVSILSPGGCESARTQVTATYPAASLDDPNASGTDSWIGHVYDGIDFNTYFGHFTEPETFNEGFGGNTTCFGIVSNSIPLSIYTETFSVKYRMNSTKKGLWAVDLGSDDGNRLTVDGSVIYADWNDHAVHNNLGVLMNLNGSSSLIYEFYERGGGNVVYFQNLVQVLANELSTNITQNICLGSSGAPISGDVYGTLPTGISLSGTGYQWTYSETPGGTRTNISGATGATYTPDASIAPFNVSGTYYIYRNAVLSSTNNVTPNPYLATNESNAVIVTVPDISGAPVVSSPICPGSTTVSGTSTEADGSNVEIFVNGVSAGTTTVTGGAWTLTVSAIANGSVITAKTTASGECESVVSNSVTVEDNVAPVLHDYPIGTLIFDPGSLCSADVDTLTWGFSSPNIVSATDICDSNPTIYFVRDAYEGSKKSFPIGTTQVTLYAIDASGNKSTGCSFTVWVKESTPPTMTPPPDQPIFCADNLPTAYDVLTAFLAAGGTATDNFDTGGCGIDNSSLTLLSEDISLPTITRTYQIADYSGNLASCEQVFTIISPPDVTITSPGLDIVCAGGGFGINSSVSGYSATMHYQWQFKAYNGSAWSFVGGDTPSFSGTLNHLGDNYRLLVSQSTDFTEGICTMVSNELRFKDVTKPVFTEWAPINKSVCTASGAISAPVFDISLDNLKVTDNCTTKYSDLLISYSITGATELSGSTNLPDGTNFNVGASTVVYTVTDLSGNFQTYSFLVTVSENPTISDISTDGTLPTPADGTGYKPYQGSSHIYSVTNDPGYTYTWTVSPAGATISGQGSASVDITWGVGTMPGDYTITVTKDDDLTHCQATKSLDVTVVNVFNPKVLDFGNACHGESGTTNIDWVVQNDVGTLVAPSWNFTWNIYLNGSPTPMSSGTETGITSISKTISIVVNIGSGGEKNYLFVISGVTDSLGNPETILTDDTDTVKIFAKPSIGF